MTGPMWEVDPISDRSDWATLRLIDEVERASTTDWHHGLSAQSTALGSPPSARR
jgi:hypothetical protein